MLLADDDVDDVNDADNADDVNDADNVNGDVDDADDAKANDNQSRKKKDHVSTLVPIESSGSWCDAPPHH
jgi:hypothetical protein